MDILTQGAKTVERIARETAMSVANASQHLQTLLEAGLVVYRKQGLYSYYQLADSSVAAFLSALQSLAEQRIAEIKRLREEFYSEKENLEQIQMPELLQRMKNGSVTLIDVRPKEEYEMLHIPGADSIPLEELEKTPVRVPAESRDSCLLPGTQLRACGRSSRTIALPWISGF